MALEDVLETITIVSLSIVLALFLVRLATPRRRKDGRAWDFGTVFSAFVAGWVSTELLAVALPRDWSVASDALHITVVLLFATWINLRWRWSLRLARGSP